MLKNTDNRLKLILFFFAFLLYANTIGHDYAWDDKIVINENPRVKKGISGIPDLFLKYNSDYKADKYGYRPITLTSFAIDHSLFKSNAHAGHFMNVLYFALLCMILFSVLRKVFCRFSDLAPFLITLIFATHPVHVEVVANIKSRDEIFALLFALLATGQLINYHQKRQLKFLGYTIFLFLLAFLSKESAIVFLGIMPLSIFYMEGWQRAKKVAVTTLFVPVFIVVCIVIIKASIGSGLGVDSTQGMGAYTESGLLGNSFFYTDWFYMKLANAFTVLILYLKNFFIPVTQLYYYGYNQIPVASWQQTSVIASCMLCVSTLAFAFIKIRKHAEIGYGIFFFFISISMYTHVFVTLSDTMADRFMFTPSLGLAVITVFVLGKLFKTDFKTLYAKDILTPQATVLCYTFLVIILLLSIKTFNRNKAWKNDEVLATTDMPYLSNSARANQYYGDMLRAKLTAGYNPAIEADMIAHYKKSYQIAGRESYYARLSLASYLLEIKRREEGIALLDTMTILFPEQADPAFYLGQAYLQKGDYNKAIAQLERSIKLAPEAQSTYAVLALAYSNNHEYKKAIKAVNISRQKFGESAGTSEALGNIYFEQGNLEQSTKAMLEMLRFGADAQKVYGTIIGRYQLKKQDSLANLYYRTALEKGIFRNGR
jgi:tetratricopeptide (TPR) repeat protein